MIDFCKQIEMVVKTEAWNKAYLRGLERTAERNGYTVETYAFEMIDNILSEIKSYAAVSKFENVILSVLDDNRETFYNNCISVLVNQCDMDRNDLISNSDAWLES